MDKTAAKSLDNSMGSRELMELRPHRYPFLLVDRVFDIVGDQSATGIKNVTVNEPFFQGHFPGNPIMPGVLLIEGMAQTAGAICVKSEEDDYGSSLVFFMTIDRARFRRPVVPGDTVYYHVQKIRQRGKVWKYRGVARVDGEIAAEAELSAMIAETGDF